MSINKSINGFFILFAFLLPFGKPVTSVVMILLILLWIMEGRWGEKIAIFKASVPFQLYMAFIVFIGLSLLWSGGLDGGFTRHGLNALEYYLQRYVFGFMIIPIMMTSLKKEYVSYIISGFLAAMFISEVLSWGVFLGWIHLKGAIPTDPTPFLHHSFYSIFIAISIFLILIQFNKSALKYKIFYSIFLVSALSNLFINGGRLGQVAFFISFIIFIFIKYHVSLKLLIKSFISMVILFTSMYMISPNFKVRMNQAYSDVNGIMNGRYISSWGYRWNMNRVSQAVVSDHPFFGAGLGGAKRVFIEKSKQFDQTEGFERWNNVHNGYMQILIETGFVGLFLFIYFIYRLWRSQMVKNDLLIISSVIVVYLIGFIGEPLFFNKVVYLLFNLFVGLSLFKSIHFSEKTL